VYDANGGHIEKGLVLLPGNSRKCTGREFFMGIYDKNQLVYPPNRKNRSNT